MKGRKLKVPNIIKKHTKVPHQNEIGTQPAFITSKPVKIKKKPLPKDKDLFYTTNSRSDTKRNGKKKSRKKPKLSSIKLLEAHKNIDITSNTYKAEEKMRGFRNMLKGMK